jgi:hypothetical protein
VTNAKPADPFLNMDSWQEPIAFAERPAQATTTEHGLVTPPSPMPGTEGMMVAPPSAMGLTELSPNGYCDGNGNILLDGGRTTDGGRPEDWSWGCGGSPYRTGPGYCDNWKVGCRWETSVDGVVMFREGADLLRLQAATNVPPEDVEVFEDFDHAPGGRISFIGYMPRWTNYQVQAQYEGAEAWNASIIYDDTLPGDELLQRSVTYRSNLHSAELNIIRNCHPVWKPYCGVRYVKFDEQIRDFTDEEINGPPPGPAPNVDFETDTINLVDISNNLMGFQVGVRRDLWRVGRMFSLQGYANAGVYHNKIKRTRIESFDEYRLQGDITGTTANEAGTTNSFIESRDVSDLTEISYLAEASITGICRLNRCCAMRAGYQILWLNNVHLAEDEFLMPVGEDQNRGLIFQGWHAGVEYRR